MGRGWQRWKALAERAATFQARVLFTIFYYLILAPFALGVRAFSDPLTLRARAGSGWVAKTPGPGSLEEARRQY